MIQLYWIDWPYYPRSEDEMPRPGQFVMEGDDSDWLAGFIAEVDTNLERCLFCLFHSTDKHVAGATVVAESMPDDQVANCLKKALDANPGMKDKWLELVKPSKRASLA